MIQVVGELATELHFLCKQPTEPMPEPIRKLPEINLLFSFQLNYVHFMLDLLVEKLKNPLTLMDLFDKLCRQFHAFHQNPRARILSTLKIPLIIKSYIFPILILEFLIYSISIVQSFSELPCVFRCYSPSVEQVVLELTFVDLFPIFVKFPKYIKFGIFQLPLENQLLLIFTVYFCHSVY